MTFSSMRRLTRPMLALTSALLPVFISGCVESDRPILTGTKPLMGETFEAHFFEKFVDGKASETHTAFYRWTNNHYVLIRGSNNRVPEFTAIPFDEQNFVVEGTLKDSPTFNYWVARKMVDGVFLIVPVDESDADEATRISACTGKKVEGFCFVEKQEELIKLAKATASKALRNPTLGVLVVRQEGS